MLKQFNKIEGYPPELVGRLNSFIVTEFDDSMTVEMQIRSLIKWIKENIKLTSEMVDYLNEFIEKFDDKLFTNVYDILSKWFEDGLFNDIFDKIARNLYVNPEWFGAKTTKEDNSIAFQTAFDFAAEQGIKVVILPTRDKPYLIRNQIELGKKHSGIQFIGGGDFSHIILNTRSERGHLLGLIGDGDDEKEWISDITISNMKLEVTYEAGTNTEGYLDNPIGISKAKNILIEHIKVPHTEWKGISAQHYCKNILINECFVNGNICTDTNGANCGDNKARQYGIGVEFPTCEQIRITNCKATNFKKQGFLITGAGYGLMNDIIISDCIAHCNDLEGFGLSFGGESVIISDCIAYSYNKSNDSVPQINGTNGIKLFNCNGSVVKNCDVRHHNLAGVYLQNSANCIIKDTTSLFNSKNDDKKRGNFWIGDSSDNCQLIHCIGNKGERSLTCSGLNLFDCNNLFTGTTLYELLGVVQQESRYISITRFDNLPVKTYIGLSTPTNKEIQYNRGDKIINKTPYPLNNKVVTGWLCVTGGIGDESVWVELSHTV